MCGPGPPPSAKGTRLAGPGESQAAAGIVTGMLTALVGSALPGPGSSIRAVSVQIKGALPIARGDDGAARGAGEAAGPGDRRAGWSVHGPDRARIVATAILEVLAPTTRQQRQVAEHRLEGLIERCRTLKPMLTGVVHPCSADALTGADRSRRGRADSSRSLRPRGRNPADRGSCASGHRQVSDRGHRGSRGLRAEGGDGRRRRRDRGTDEG